MGFLDAAARFFGMTLQDRPEITLLTPAEDAVDKILHAREHPKSGHLWRLPTVADALGVPSIQRAVSLISTTTGMLSMQGFRNGELMPEPPRLIARPDPDEDPFTFYSVTAAQSAKYGEFVWWIASRDGDGNASALVNVPLNELRVDKNPDSRRFPRYQWGSIRSTRYSPANPTGQFVHKKYALTEPYALRGEGPLQLGKIAVSISVESQIWASNFYGGGGHASDIIKHAGILDPTLRDEFDAEDPDNGLSEADRLKAQYIARDNNTPLVIDSRIEDIKSSTIDPTGAQMLEARLHQNGDAARLFGLPGKFVEYVQSGTSLTYQTLESAFTDLVKTCLQPLYLEPIEQAMSDLLPRTTAARFNVKGFLRADVKTRYEVHGIAIDKGIYDPAYAQKEEGILPGDVEYAPIPFAPPQATPTLVPRAASLTVDWRCSNCDAKLLDVAGPGSRATCRRCKTANSLEPAEEAERRFEIHNHAPEPAPLNLSVSIPQTETSIAAMADKVAAMTAGVDQMREEMAALGSRVSQVDTRLSDVASDQSALTATLNRKRRYVPRRGEDGVIVTFDEDTAA